MSELKKATELTILPYQQDDYNLLCAYLRDHGHNPESPQDLPKIGLKAVSWNGVVIAFGFIRISDGIGIIDSLVTNPNSPAKLRSQAVDEITEGLISVAKDHKIKYLMAFTVKGSIARRAIKRHGFSLSSAMTLLKTLG